MGKLPFCMAAALRRTDRVLCLRHVPFAASRNHERCLRPGRYNAASLAQTEASYCSIRNNLVEIDRQIRQTENQLCSLLGWTPRTIKRGGLDEWRAPEQLSVGIPLRVLSRRPDVRQAEQTLAETQIGQIANRLSEISGVITLYQALGGGVR